MKRLLTLCLLLSLLLTLACPVSATEVETETTPETETSPDVDEEGDIIYTDGNEKFVFITDSAYSDTDQFHNFKTVMPGDVLEQHILLRNDISNDRKIKVYMRALGAHEGSDHFLGQLKLTLIKDTDTVLFEATADQAAQLTEWVYLGTLYSGGECNLTVKLEVPVTMGNEFANSVGYLDWEFGVSEHPVDEDDPKPETGDTTNLGLWLALGGGALAGMILLLLLSRKKKEET